MGRSNNPPLAAGLQHPQPQQPPSPLNSSYSAQQHQRMHSPLPLSLPSMTPPARAGSSSSSRPHSRHVSVSRGASQPPAGLTPLAAPSTMALPSPSLQPPLHQPPPIQPQAHTQTQVKQLAKRSTSPERPPVSPITPPLTHIKPESQTITKKIGRQNNRTIIISKPNKAAQSAQQQQQSQPQQSTQQPAQQLPPRPELSHISQPDMTANTIPPPAPLPLDLETNPDAIALQSAIAILQMQRRRAEADIISLQRAKNEALAMPDAFLRDLQSGVVKMAGGLVPGEHNAGETIPSYSDSDDSSSSSDDDDTNDKDGDTEMRDSETNGGEGSSKDPAAAASAARAAKKKTRAEKKKQKPPKPAWANLPSEQNIVRYPPINWAQYAIVSESLDKLHAEQLARPNTGAPAVFTAVGTYEFRGATGASAGAVGAAAAAATATGPGERYLGIAAPYVPGRDVLPSTRRKNSAAGGGGGGRKNAKPPGRPPKR
ncbi:hypothetical protein BROUX41_004695 [Berkeleyomyces rouxiae]